MKITGIELSQIKSFDNVPMLDFSSSINVLIGPNNAGKSTILNSIFLLQRDGVLTANDITLGALTGIIGLYFTGGHAPTINENQQFEKVQIDLKTRQRRIVTKNGSTLNIGRIDEKEPNNLIYPYLSKRKVVQFVDAINEQNANSVFGNFTNLYSKIDRLVTPQFQPGNSQYVNACKDILGFEISTLAKGNGKQAVLFIHNLEHIPLTAMGEGVANILGLITDLCVAEERIFLIEEPENDIHPKALKALLNLIISKSESNQFFISTHSNIVMKHLGAIPDSKIFRVINDKKDKKRPNLKLSTIQEVQNNPEERKKVLEDLGYDFFDYDLWKAWLFLEESSAEVLIRDYFIKWYTPKLKYQLRTFSAGSISKIQSKFDDFNRLFVFLHLEPTYKNKVWVYIDGGEKEAMIIKKMRDVYAKSGWNENNFNQFSEHDFEMFYPSRFQEGVQQAIGISDKQEKRTAKRELLERVKDWIKGNEQIAKEEFKESAKEVILILKAINKELNKNT